MPEGVARLALRTGAAVVGAVGVRRGGQIITRISPPFEITVTGDRHRDAQELTQTIVSWLEGHLRNYPGAILIVTHDRYFLDNVTGWILELDRGKGIPYEGNYSSWLVQKQKRLEQEGREDAAHQKTLAREQE